MTQPMYMIGVDIGTTSTKAVLFEQSGKVVTKANEAILCIHLLRLSQNRILTKFFGAVLQSLKRVMDQSQVRPEQVMFVSFSSAMHSVIAVDAEGKPLTRCITWGDNRSVAWAERLKHEMNGHHIYLRTGTPIHPMSPLPKLMWLRHDHEHLFQKASKFISIKEYVFCQTIQ